MKLVEEVKLELQSEEYSHMLLENSVSLGEFLLSCYLQFSLQLHHYFSTRGKEHPCSDGACMVTMM